MILLTKYKIQLDNPRHKRKDIFRDISTEMCQLSQQKYQPTFVQCGNRYKTLVRKYKEVKDHNNTSGNDHKQWKFFDDMEEGIKNKSNITPVASCSSLELRVHKTVDENIINLKNTLGKDLTCNNKIVVQKKCK